MKLQYILDHSPSSTQHFLLFCEVPDLVVFMGYYGSFQHSPQEGLKCFSALSSVSVEMALHDTGNANAAFCVLADIVWLHC